jgi:hypothetical protein
MLAVWAQVECTAMVWVLFGVDLFPTVSVGQAAIVRELFALSVR